MQVRVHVASHYQRSSCSSLGPSHPPPSVHCIPLLITCIPKSRLLHAREREADITSSRRWRLLEGVEEEERRRRRRSDENGHLPRCTTRKLHPAAPRCEREETIITSSLGKTHEEEGKGIPPSASGIRISTRCATRARSKTRFDISLH